MKIVFKHICSSKYNDYFRPELFTTGGLTSVIFRNKTIISSIIIFRGSEIYYKQLFRLPKRNNYTHSRCHYVPVRAFE